MLKTGTSLLSILGKVIGRAVKNRVIDCTESWWGRSSVASGEGEEM